MSLDRVEIRDFRCLETADLSFDARLNLVSGPNASGKTSLLEAIYFLGRGRSFRTSRNETLIRRGAQELRVTGQLRSGGSSWRPVGVAYRRDGFEVRAGGERVHSLAELATIFPVQAIDPEVHRLVEGGPQERRRFLDWGVFHVEPPFVDQWRRYQRALKQRNAALRAGMDATVVRAWDGDLVTAGTVLAESRRRYVDALHPDISSVGRRLLDLDVSVTLHDGWPADTSLKDALEHAWHRDREGGTTHVGPHRADLAVRVEGEFARNRVSRGQQKLTACALLLGQLQCDHRSGSPTVALLVDDPAAELDESNLERLTEVIRDLPGQLFVTALDPRKSAFQRLPEGHRFHVEHGEISRLI